MKKRSLLTLCCFIVTIGFAFGQSKKIQLEKERKSIQQEIKQIQDEYNQVKKEGRQSLSQLNILSRKIALQEQYISTINKELKAIDDDMYLSGLEIYRLQKQYDTLKAEYARSVVYAYRNRSSFSYVNFIFSASSFNDAIRRIAYLRNYRADRAHQVEKIQQTQALIHNRQQQQLARKQEKSERLKDQTDERASLAEQREEKNKMLAGFKTEEKNLQKQILAKKKRDRDLQNAIAAIIRREIEIARKEEAIKLAAARKAKAAQEAKEARELKEAKARSVSPLSGKSRSAIVKTAALKKPVEKPAERTAERSILELNDHDVILGSDFRNSRGKLPWPVDNGYVSIPFGNYIVPGVGISGNNPGVTIDTKPNASVKAVFDGVVSAVHNYGDGAAIVIRHGKYYTTYANLSAVNISKGVTVKRGQLIGRVGDSEDLSHGRIDFLLMIETNNVNPEGWLRK
ncbi:MAG: hypothetical protein DI535_14785 [Citrobacter freundii]|nr:MAG: hypothetical protein DI535_14785 [Citrobacter freundii]